MVKKRENFADSPAWVTEASGREDQALKKKQQTSNAQIPLNKWNYKKKQQLWSEETLRER